jgi:hypothetical protein
MRAVFLNEARADIGPLTEVYFQCVDSDHNSHTLHLDGYSFLNGSHDDRCSVARRGPRGGTRGRSETKLTGPSFDVPFRWR